MSEAFSIDYQKSISNLELYTSGYSFTTGTCPVEDVTCSSCDCGTFTTDILSCEWIVKPVNSVCQFEYILRRFVKDYTRAMRSKLEEVSAITIKVSTGGTSGRQIVLFEDATHDFTIKLGEISRSNYGGKLDMGRIYTTLISYTCSCNK